MPTLHIPSQMRKLTGGLAKVGVDGATLGEAVEALEAAHPGVRERLVEEGELRGGLALFVDGEMVRTGLRSKLAPESEVYFAPAVAGGMPTLHIPPKLRRLVDRRDRIDVEGATVAEALETLERAHPGVLAGLVEHDALRKDVTLIIGMKIVDTGLETPVEPGSQVFFAPGS